jgi:signal transduction histidine kinase/CHASE3 domain sensor protein
MTGSWAGWWNGLRVRQKVLTILVLVFVPLVVALGSQVFLINHLLGIQQQHRQTVSARYQIVLLRRLAVNIEDAFRGYLLTGEELFLNPLKEAEPKIVPTIERAMSRAAAIPGLPGDIRTIEQRLRGLLESKKSLIEQIRLGQRDEVLSYVRSGQGLAMSDALRDDLRLMEDHLDRLAQGFEVDREALVRQVFWGLLLVVGGTLFLGLLGARMLTRSIAGPLGVLQRSADRLGRDAGDLKQDVPPIAIASSDEIGRLARSFEEMVGRVRQHVRELEGLNAVGVEINTIGPDGLPGVLQRITNRAAQLLNVDVCLVMLRDERMGCWIVEAASGDWHDRLHKSVMLWEEFPVSVQAYVTREPAIGEDLHREQTQETRRRNLIGESMMALPLLAQGIPFGVLALLRQQSAPAEAWNLRLAKGFAAAAAMAISNARLYEEAQRKGKGLEIRLRELEHLAESLAHDLKGPGERMEGLAWMLLREYGGRLDERATRWLKLMEQNGDDLIRRVEDILEVARVGSRREAIEAVDSASVLDEVVKGRSSELAGRCARVLVESEFPLVACHRAYLRQVFDNLISNAVKFSGERPDFTIRISAAREADRLEVSVADNGPGIPPKQRERVLEPFVRLEPAAAKGSGIGLAIVKRIVELYGGRVWIESNQDGGCTVRFTLPLLGDLSAAASRRIEIVEPGGAV